MMWWNAGQGWAWGWGMALWGLVMMALFWGAIAAIVVVAIRAARGPSSAPPLDIARRRYAAGEISRDQFEQIRRDLGS